VLSSVSSNAGGWVNSFLVDVRITNFVFETKSSSLAMPGVIPLSISASFILGILSVCLVVGFLGGIFLQKRKNYSELSASHDKCY
jgi:hypothetical protein